MQKEQMIIPANRKRIPVFFMVNALMAVGLAFIIYPYFKGFRKLDLNGKIDTALLLCSLVFVLFFFFVSGIGYVKLLFNKKAGLCITKDGFEDTLGLRSIGFISWLEITDVVFLSFPKNDFLVIKVLNPEALIKRKNWLLRKSMRACLRKQGGPIMISHRQISHDLKDLREIMLKHIQ
jgi:hypothetical protein